MVRMGACYRTGYGVRTDLAAARQWGQKGADADNFIAMYALGTVYMQGTGVEIDPQAATKWFADSAGYAPAKEMLAKIQKEGRNAFPAQRPGLTIGDVFDLIGMVSDIGNALSPQDDPNDLDAQQRAMDEFHVRNN